MKDLHQKTPCKDCPFTKTSLKWWLWEQRIKEILKANTFVCHKSLMWKRKERKQCAWHMIIKWGQNMYVSLSKMLWIDTKLSWQERVFSSEQECIKHHTK